MRKKRILVVCSRNKSRSPTAESIYRGDNRVEVRSAGLSNKSTHVISTRDVEWADLILCMEQKHVVRLKALFHEHILPEISSLEIEDDYDYMDPELVELLSEKIDAVITNIGRL